MHHKHHFYRHDLEQGNVFPRQYRHCTRWDFDLKWVKLHSQDRLGSEAERRSHHGCYRCGAGILMHLSDRDHMLIRSSHRLALPKRQAPALSWPSSEAPADIRRDGGVARMSNPSVIEEIQAAVTTPCHGQGAHWPLRRVPDRAGYRCRLYRRKRSPHTCRRYIPC